MVAARLWTRAFAVLVCLLTSALLSLTGVTAASADERVARAAGAAKLYTPQAPHPSVLAPKTAPPALQPDTDAFHNHLLLSPDEIKSGEILGLNLSQDAVGDLQREGARFVGREELPNLGITIARFRPAGEEHTSGVLARVLDRLPAPDLSFNYIYGVQPSAAAQDPDQGQGDGIGCRGSHCYGPKLINWQPMLAECTRGMRVGVIDTRVDRSHPAFERSRIVYGAIAPTGRSGAPTDHGTGVLSILAGNPNSGVPGLIPYAEFFVAEPFYANEVGQPVSDTYTLLKAMDWMLGRRVDVVNMSLAGPHDPALHWAVQRLSAKGAVIVAAAGNEGPRERRVFPAAYPEVIGVTAVDSKKSSYRYANRGPHIDVAAPGVGIWTALPGRRFGIQSGTSFAVPFVTAALAAVTAVGPSDNWMAVVKTKGALVAQLDPMDLGELGYDTTYGHGLVRAPTRCGPRSLPQVTPADELEAARARWPGVSQKVSLERR